MPAGRSSTPLGTSLGSSEDQMRLMAKIARMYHERGLRQAQIAAELHVSQPRVSRLLKRAGEVGIVRTTVSLPPGVHTDLEDALEAGYGLDEAVVVDVEGPDETLTQALGAAGAHYLESTLIGGDTVGISSWSATLLAAVEAMRPSRGPVVDMVVQLVGGVGDPEVQLLATRLIGLFAQQTGASPVFMPAPAMLGTPAARDSLAADASVAAVMDLWPRLTLALVGIGSVEPSPLLQQSGNALVVADLEQLRARGVVGDVCFRFFDGQGEPVRSEVDDRVIGISAQQLRGVPRRVGIAGGRRKHAAVQAALRGGWVNVLVTDVGEARRLVEEAEPVAPSAQVVTPVTGSGGGA